MKTLSLFLSTLKNVGRHLKIKHWLSFAALFFLFINSFAQPANIIIQPASTTTIVGQSFTVAVRVEFTGTNSPQGVDVVEVHLTFDKTKLQVTNIVKSAIGSLPSEAIPLQSVININNAGQIDYNAGTTSNFPTTDFDFLTITFNVISGAGSTSPLTFLTAFPNKTDAIRNFSSILGNTVDGLVTINNSGCTAPTGTITNTSSCNGQAFSLVLSNGATGASPFDLVINGTTYNDIAPGGVITTITPPTEKIWPTNPVPTQPSNNDGSAIEVGLKFKASVAGFVKGIRFYNGASNAGTYTGKLYNSSGTLLGSKDFIGVSTNGWQEITFSSPVQISANTVYVASYYSTAGNYAQSDNYFTTNNTGVTTGSLTALGYSDDPANGVFHFPGEGFPSTAWAGHGPNYWVDVIFSPDNYTYNLTSITDNNGCNNTGAPLQHIECGLPILRHITRNITEPFGYTTG